MDAGMYVYVFLLVGTCISYVSVFGAYFLLGRKTCKPGQMSNIALLVALFTVLCALLVRMIPIAPPSITTIFSLWLTMYYARRVLRFSAGRSWAAVGLCVLFTLLIFFLIAMFAPSCL